MDAAYFVVSIDDAILIRVGASYVKGLHKTGTMKYSLLSYNIIAYIKLIISIMMT